MSTPAARAVDGLSEVQLRAWRSFLYAHAAVVEVLERELRAEEDLPLTWYDVLVNLSEAPDRSLRMQELADAVVLSKSGLTRLVDRMEDGGLVERVACPDDRRGTLARLTDAGYERLRGAAPSHIRGVREHFARHLSDGEAQVLADALERIVAARSATEG